MKQLNKRRLSLLNPVSILCFLALVFTALPSYALSTSDSSIGKNESYTITYQSGRKYRLQEKVGANGRWTFLSRSHSGKKTFKKSVANTYYYRTYRFGCGGRKGRGGCRHVSKPISVTVLPGPSIPLDTHEVQQQYQFETRVGDINYDGRKDIYIRRLSGNANNGVLSQTILVQNSNLTFKIHNASSSQLTKAKSWSKVNITVALGDFNLDGYIDVFLKGVSSAISGAKDQLVFSKGIQYNGKAQAVTTIDDNFKKTFSSVANWIVDKNYFKNNIKIGYRWVYYPRWVFWRGEWRIIWTWVRQKVAYYDPEKISREGYLLAYGLNFCMTSGELNAGSNEAKFISKVLEHALGIDFMDDALSSEKIRLPHEDDIPLEWLPQIRLENVIEIVNDLLISGNYQTLSEPKNVSNPVNSCGGVLVCKVYNNQTGGVGRGYREGLFDKEVVKWGRYNCLCGTTPFNFVGPGKDYLRLYGVSGSHTPVREYVNPFTVNPNGYYDKWKYETFIESFKKNYQTIPNHLKP